VQDGRVSNLEPAPAETECGGAVAVAGRYDLLPGRDVPLGRFTTVNRLLPHTSRRTVGAWCFVDHFGPDVVGGGPGMQVPPHPHCGLQTVTWLADGEILHRDSLGSLAMIRPGQLNLMTAGHGIAHAEQSPDGHGPVLHGLQLWIALPAAGASMPPRFEHHEDLPGYADGGANVTVVIGELHGHRSPARAHTPIVGADLRLAAGATLDLRLRPDFEHALLVLAGAATVATGAEGGELVPGALLYLGADRQDLRLSTASGARLFLLGGEPLAEELVMWWNFVARSHEEIVAAREAWASDTDPRFGAVEGHDGDPLPAPEMPTVRLKPRGRDGRRID
jgi:redox-sensitive bicupin YhaK (pirin superfamily)